MEDDHYLDEEAGRRATSRRLLRHVEKAAPHGRLLEVGCGHGLLLDEARRRGWAVTGLEPARAARAHAESLGLDVRDALLDDLDPATDGGYEAIVMADVIEHLEDPVGALRAAAALLAPGGALCVVTPDPSSKTARLAGARWWGYLPAHTVLLPRRTLLRPGVPREMPLIDSSRSRPAARPSAGRFAVVSRPSSRWPTSWCSTR